MNQSSKDPFEAAFEEQAHEQQEISVDPFEAAFEEHAHEQQEIAVDSPTNADDMDTQKTTVDDQVTSSVRPTSDKNNNNDSNPSTSDPPNQSSAAVTGKNKDEEEEEEDESMEVALGKFSSTGDPDKMAKMQAILSQLDKEQMTRYESFRRSGFQKANMKKLLTSITGSPKISMPMTIVVSGIAKMFVGDLVETGRMVMNERSETGPIRPCHIREAYRRLKLEGKIPKRSIARLFR